MMMAINDKQTVTTFELSVFSASAHLLFREAPRGRWNSHPCFIDEETETQRPEALPPHPTFHLFDVRLIWPPIPATYLC